MASSLKLDFHIRDSIYAVETFSTPSSMQLVLEWRDLERRIASANLGSIDIHFRNAEEAGVVRSIRHATIILEPNTFKRENVELIGFDCILDSLCQQFSATSSSGISASYCMAENWSDDDY